MAARTSPAKATPPRAPATRAAAPEPCPVCAGTVTQPARGRRRRYCSAPCRKTAHRRRRDGQKRRALVRLVEADAHQFLAALPDESVDLVVTDPPYHFARGTTYFRDWFAELPDEAWRTILSELHRVLRRDRHAYVFCDRRIHTLLEDAARSAGFRVHPPLIWDKDRLGLGSGPWRSSYELILFLEKGRRAGNHKTQRNILRARAPVRRYPTEKPVEVLGTLIGQASLPGELVLDPFCGSGSVGQAARALGRRALLCDVDAAYAAGRLRLAPTTLRETAAGRNGRAAGA